MATIDDIWGASKIITVDGVDGFHSAAAIVGSEMAHAMLITFLRVKLNSNNEYPEPDNIQSRIEEILNKNNI